MSIVLLLAVLVLLLPAHAARLSTSSDAAVAAIFSSGGDYSVRSLLAGLPTGTPPAHSCAANTHFWDTCWEKQACLLRPRRASIDEEEAGRITEWMPEGMRSMESIMTNTAGSWLMEELSLSKQDRCRRNRRAAGCLWGDGSTLPGTYFTGEAGQQSLRDIRGSAGVQDDIVVGDTMKKSIAEDQLLSYVRERRHVHHAGSVTGDHGRILGDEWRAFAEDTNQTLFVRDADGRSGPLSALAASIQALFQDPRPYLSTPSGRRGSSNGSSLPFHRSGGVDVGVSLYYTPPRCASTVPAHIDTMDVLAIQLAGCKRWTLTAPHVNYFLPPTPVILPLSREHYRSTARELKQQSQRRAASSVDVDLCAGDVLYVPRGIIHNTSTVVVPTDGSESSHPQWGRGSLHISVGIETSPDRTVGSYIVWNARDMLPPRVDSKTTTSATTSSDCSSAAPFDECRLLPPPSQGQRCVSSALWAAVPRSSADLVRLAAGRALLHTLRDRVVQLRHGLVIPDAVLTRGIEEGEGECGEPGLQGGGSCGACRIEAHLMHILRNTRMAVRSFLTGRGVGRRWTRLTLDTFGTVAALRTSADVWWPPKKGAGQEMDVIIGILTSTVLNNIQGLLASAATSHPCGFAEVDELYDALAEELIMWMVPNPQDGIVASLAAREATPQQPNVTARWAQWLDEALQRSHEERLAFAEWTWINDILMRSAPDAPIVVSEGKPHHNDEPL